MLSKEQIDNIKELASKATPGEWWSSNGGNVTCLHGNGCIAAIALTMNRAEDGDYIAAANPAAVLELIAMLCESQKDAARYGWLVTNSESDHECLSPTIPTLYAPSWNFCRLGWDDEIGKQIDAAMQRDDNGEQQ